MPDPERDDRPDGHPKPGLGITSPPDRTSRGQHHSFTNPPTLRIKNGIRYLKTG